MRLSPRHICILILGISIVLKSNEAPIQRSKRSEISTTQDENKFLTASYIPPFLRNLYHTISQSPQSSQTPLQIFKGFFEGADVYENDFLLSFPSLHSDTFFNFTFARAEIRVWYQCTSLAPTLSPFYLQLDSYQFGQEFRSKIPVSCNLKDDANRPALYGWAVFDVTDFLQSLQTTHRDHVKQALKFSVQTSSNLIRINKQHFATKYNPTHMPLLAFYHRRMLKHLDPTGVTMRYVPSRDDSTDEQVGSKRNVRQLMQQNIYSPCSRVSKNIKVRQFLKIFQSRDFDYLYPTRMNLGYCDGYCPYRLIKHHNGTAHSQYLNAIARKNHRPRYATCVPVAYNMLYVLQSYRTDGISVATIRAYQNASVRYCGCR